MEWLFKQVATLAGASAFGFFPAFVIEGDVRGASICAGVFAACLVYWDAHYTDADLTRSG